MSESHEEHMEELRKYEVEDPLKYKEFEYDRNEWDNIPTIIPRFVLFMSKHLEAIVDKWGEKFNQISTPDLQQQIDLKLKALNDKIDKIHHESNGDHNKLIEQITNIETVAKKIEKESEVMKLRSNNEWNVKMQDLIPVPSIEDFVKQFEKDEQLVDQEEGGEIEKGEDEEPNELGIIVKEKEWFKKTNEQ
jgi:organic radical activating enzyme